MYSKPNTTVMGQKVPPPGRPRRLDAAPTPLDNTTATPIGKATTPALLHSAYVTGGQARCEVRRRGQWKSPSPSDGQVV
jgi:hypothetical protein